MTRGPGVGMPDRGYVPDMGLMRKTAAFGIAKKLFDEARKPHNQAKIRSAFDSLKGNRKRGRSGPSR